MVQSPFDECWMKGSLCSTHYAKSRLAKASILQYDSPPLHYSRSKRFQTSVVDCLSFVMVQDPVNREGCTADDVSEGLKCE